MIGRNSCIFIMHNIQVRKKTINGWRVTQSVESRGQKLIYKDKFRKCTWVPVICTGREKHFSSSHW